MDEPHYTELKTCKILSRYGYKKPRGILIILLNTHPVFAPGPMMKYLSILLLIYYTSPLMAQNGDNVGHTSLSLKKSIPGSSLAPMLKSLSAAYGVSVSVTESDEDLPFDNSTWGGYIMNWIAKLLLWFIYLMVIMMILGGTLWFLNTTGFWSWVLCLIGAFFYAMLLGRYWGYTACLIGFVILFSGMKIFLTSDWGRKKLDRFSNPGLAERMQKLTGKSARKK